jgi:hypothetical protein
MGHEHPPPVPGGGAARSRRPRARHHFVGRSGVRLMVMSRPETYASRPA